MYILDAPQTPRGDPGRKEKGRPEGNPDPGGTEGAQAPPQGKKPRFTVFSGLRSQGSMTSVSAAVIRGGDDHIALRSSRHDALGTQPEELDCQ